MKIKDVAARAGVSPATVSRVINGDANVSSEYRKRVLEAMKELEYHPNRLASNLRRQKAKMIGVVISDVENPHFSQLVRAVEDAAYQIGYRVLLCNTDETAEKQYEYLEILAAERVAGVMLAPPNPHGQEIGHILDLGIPLVSFDRDVDDLRADAIGVNNALGARQATEHLLRAGHKRIGLVAGPSTVETGEQRTNGYKAAMSVAGLTPRIADGRFTIDGGSMAAAQLLTAPEPPTALVVANNLMTLGTLQWLRRHNIRIPQDVALVVIDDPVWATLFEPPLTALAQPVQLMAQAAIRLLFERMNGQRQESTRLTFDFELRVRGSCGTVALGGEQA